jgi:hypothetical protein
LVSKRTWPRPRQFEKTSQKKRSSIQIRAIWIDDRNTAAKGYISLTQLKQNSKIVGYRYNGKDIAEFGHTHDDNPNGFGPNKSPGDPTYPTIQNFIWYKDINIIDES